MSSEHNTPDARNDPATASDVPGSAVDSTKSEDPPPLLDPITARRVEEEDRKRPIPGGEPACPLCSKKMVRRVERYPAPHGGESPFRVRLVCSDASCGAWTVYDW